MIVRYCETCGRVATPSDERFGATTHAKPGTRGRIKCPGVVMTGVVGNGVPALVGVARAAEILGVSKAGGLQRLREADRMPAPAADVPDVPSPVYRRADIERLAEELEFERTQRQARREQQISERTPS